MRASAPNTANESFGVSPKLMWFGVFVGPIVGSFAGWFFLLFVLKGLGNNYGIGGAYRLAQIPALVLGSSLLALPGTYWVLRKFLKKRNVTNADIKLADLMRVGFECAKFFGMAVVLVVVCYGAVMSYLRSGNLEGLMDGLLSLVGGTLVLGIAYLISWTCACFGVLFGVPICWSIAKKFKLVSVEN